MKIFEISKADKAGGGASAVAEMLCDEFRANGNPTLHYTYWADKGYNYSRRNIYGENWTQFSQLNEQLKRQFSLAETFPLEVDHLKSEITKFGFEIAHFHDISSAISVRTLQRLARIIPTVWTLHDCSPFTGGCLYPMDCTRYILPRHCGKCPQLGQWPVDTKWDTTWLSHRLKTRAHGEGRITLVSPSQWMADQAKGSGLVKGDIQIIPNGIDTDAFYPRNRRAARKSLALPDDHIVLATISGHLSDERKNVSAAIDAIKALGRNDVTLLLIGNSNPQVIDATRGFNVIFSGYVHTSEGMAQALSAADAYIFTSLAENHPLSVLEAMACGLPILGFGTGGVAEQVVPGVNGLLAETSDTTGLLSCIQAGLESGKLAEWGMAGNTLARRYYTRNRMADDYMTLFRSLTATKVRVEA